MQGTRKYAGVGYALRTFVFYTIFFFPFSVEPGVFSKYLGAVPIEVDGCRVRGYRVRSKVRIRYVL